MNVTESLSVKTDQNLQFLNSVIIYQNMLFLNSVIIYVWDTYRDWIQELSARWEGRKFFCGLLRISSRTCSRASDSGSVLRTPKGGAKFGKGEWGGGRNSSRKGGHIKWQSYHPIVAIMPCRPRSRFHSGLRLPGKSVLTGYWYYLAFFSRKRVKGRESREGEGGGQVYGVCVAVAAIHHPPTLLAPGGRVARVI